MKIKYIIIIILLITGCSKNTSTNKLIIDCNGKTKTYMVEKGDSLKCNLLGDEYTFKITKINIDKIYITIDNYGLTTSSSLLEKQNKFTITKNNKVKLRTQSTDYQEYVFFTWK